jgi:hypothetical protein
VALLEGRSPAPLPPRRDPKTTLSVGRARARSMVAGLGKLYFSGCLLFVSQLWMSFMEHVYSKWIGLYTVKAKHGGIETAQH